MKISRVLLSALVVCLACEPRHELADTVATKAGSAIPTASAESHLATRADVRQACTRVAAMLRSSGARAVVEADTLVDSSAYDSRSMACIVDADSFRVAPSDGLFQGSPLDSGWTWHPFEPEDNQTYGIVRDSVQCEVTPEHLVGARRGQDPARARVRRFHVFCYQM